MTTTPLRDRVVAGVRAAVRAHLAPLGPGVVGVACSGGADSIALADAAIAAVGAANVIVLAIDHALTAAGSAAAHAVAAWARGQGAHAVVRGAPVAAGSSLEAAARAARYAALDALADELGVMCVLMGHTARDQAETVLLRVLRGTGPAGLAAIPARRGRFVRPLLALDRAAIDAYVAARALPVWDDPMNADRRFARVRVRRDLLPALRRENPQLDAALARLADSAAEWLEVIDAHARPHARFPIAAAALAREPVAIRKRALALALEAEGLGHEAAHLEAIDRLAQGPARGERSIDLGGAAVVRSYDVLTVRRPHAAPPARCDLDRPLAAGYAERAWRPGDRMRPARLRGRSRKLSDLYIDAKVPRAARAAARVVVRQSDGEIVWAEHVGSAFEAPCFEAPGPARSGEKF